MIEYTDSTITEQCGTSSLAINSINIVNSNDNIENRYNYQKNLLILLSELNLVERQINEQRHKQLESILSSKKEIDKHYIQLISQHYSINLDIINIRQQVYSMLSNS